MNATFVTANDISPRNAIRGGIFLQDYIFPIFCVECEKEGEIWCKKCRQQFNVAGIFLCPVCGLPADNGRTHATCVGGGCLDGLITIAPYRDNSPLAILIKQLKYHFVIDEIDWIGELLRNWLAFNFEQAREIFSGRIIIPVPLHSRRLRERGFNQAELIARSLRAVLIERELAVEIDCQLKRVRYTGAQAQLNDSARRKNMITAFQWPNEVNCPQKILLIDDVYTTGATMNTVAKALKFAGAQSVWGLALLRG